MNSPYANDENTCFEMARISSHTWRWWSGLDVSGCDPSNFTAKSKNLICVVEWFSVHFTDVIMSAMAFQITSLTIVYSTVYLGADKRKHQSSTSLAFVRGIHRWPLNSPHKGAATRKMVPFDDVIMEFYSGFSRVKVFCESDQFWMHGSTDRKHCLPILTTIGVGCHMYRHISPTFTHKCAGIIWNTVGLSIEVNFLSSAKVRILLVNTNCSSRSSDWLLGCWVYLVWFQIEL